MKVLVACEYSGIVRDAFIKRGHDAISCDFLPTERKGPHFEGDVLDIIDQGWDMMIAHPPCTHLAVSGARWFKDKQKEQTAEKPRLGVTGHRSQDRPPADLEQASSRDGDDQGREPP